MMGKRASYKQTLAENCLQKFQKLESDFFAKSLLIP